MTGTALDVTVDRVVDGDTVRVFLHDGDADSESLRLLALDTEETHPGSKPVTPLGRAASERAKELLPPGARARIVLPGSEPEAEALARHRGNFGRLLSYLELADGTDFQELMIREGLSPYFQKYGYAHFPARHAAYRAAERTAQADRLGIWDQIAGNGAVMRDYAPLSTWWDLRARVIEEYRDLRRADPARPLFNSRVDYAELVARARAQETVTVFMELRDHRPTNGGGHVTFSTGSLAQPFTVFVPDANEGAGADVMNLALTRFVADGVGAPRRSYVYVTGATKMFPDDDGAPEVIVTSADQITDLPPG